MDHIDQINTPKAPAPVGPYTQAVRAGSYVFCSGQIGLLPDTGVLPNTFEDEVRQAFENLSAVLFAAGAQWSDVVKVELFLTDIERFSTVNELYAAYVAHGSYPARVTVGVSALPKGARFEIAAIAYV